MMKRQRHPALDHLTPMIGEWDLTGSHPMMAGVVIRGHASFEWLGDQFVIWRSRYEDPNIPTGIAIIGPTGADTAESIDQVGNCVMTYFDSRGVSRIYQFGAEGSVWRFWRDSPELAQRFENTISADLQTVTGKGQMSKHGGAWETDLQLTYRRAR
jgi:hypothetical protein